MPTVGSDSPTNAAAGGVLSGTFPNPSFSGSVVTQTQAATKATNVHRHASTDINTGTFPIARIPTSTELTSVAVTRADDPRLASTEPRAWVSYVDEPAPDVGQAPTWNGTSYTPKYLPTTAPLPDSSFIQMGAIRLNGDLGGTATAPRLARVTPLGGAPLPLDGKLGYTTVDFSSAPHFYLDVNGPTFYLSPASLNGVWIGLPGQCVTLEVGGVGSTNPSTKLTVVAKNASGINPPGVTDLGSQEDYSSWNVLRGKRLIMKLRYSGIQSRWLIVEANQES